MRHKVRKPVDSGVKSARPEFDDNSNETKRTKSQMNTFIAKDDNYIETGQTPPTRKP